MFVRAGPRYLWVNTGQFMRSTVRGFRGSTSSTVKVLGGSRSASTVRGFGGDRSTNPVRGLAGYTSADQFGSGYTKGSPGVGSSYKAAPFGHTRPQGHGDTLKPPRQIFTIPVPVQVTVTVVDHLQDCWVWIFWF